MALAWTARTIRGRYQQSTLGWLWAIAQPAAQVAILAVVFTRVIRVDTGGVPYVVFCCAGILPWTFLATALADMTDSLVANMSLVTKSYFHREAIPVAAMLARMMDLLIGSLLLLGLLVVYGRPVFTGSWAVLPLIVLIQVAVVLGIGLMAATLNVFFRDVKSLMTLGIQMWFYASPIIYPVTLVPEAYRALYMMNPMAGVLQAYRDVLVYNVTPGGYLLQSAAGAALLMVVGTVVFRRLEPMLADVI